MEETIHAINDAIGKNDYAAIISIFNIQWNRLGTGEQRSVAAHFIYQAVRTTTPPDDPTSSCFLENSVEPLLDTYMTALNHLPATVENAADTVLRRVLFQYLVDRRQDYSTAARVLAGTRIQDNGLYEMSPTDAADLFVSVAECFLQEDEIAEADASVTKAGQYLAHHHHHHHQALEVPTALWLRYKTTNARVLDANRKFSAAARSYHELSQHEAIEEQLQLLARAITCAILDTSHQRYKVLTSLAADVRLMSLATELPEFAMHVEIALAMHRLQIVTLHQVQTVESTLADHQRVKTSIHNLTLLQRSVMQHNMMAVSKLYDSIRLQQLASILNMDNVQMAEQVTAKMIQEKSLAACLDEVDGIVDFFPIDSSTTTTTTVTTNSIENADVAWFRQLNATVKAIQLEHRPNTAAVVTTTTTTTTT